MDMNAELFAFTMPGGGEMILILVVILIFFGAKKLPELAKGLGQGIKEFKKATRDVQSDMQRAIDNVDEGAEFPGSRRASKPKSTETPPVSSPLNPEPVPSKRDKNQG